MMIVMRTPSIISVLGKLRIAYTYQQPSIIIYGTIYFNTESSGPYQK